VWFYIDSAGTTVKTQLSKSSGYPALDEAALTVAQTMRFSPALNRTQKVHVWVEIPIVFSAPGGSNLSAEQRARLDEMARRGEAPTVPPTAPQRAPMSVRPELLNADEVARALDRNYPPLLRDAGIGGVPVVWFFVDIDGLVKKAQLSKSSGHASLDEAAIRVASVLRFSPAMKDGEKVATWVELPIAFGDVPIPPSAPSKYPLSTATDPANALTPLEPLRAGQPKQEAVGVRGERLPTTPPAVVPPAAPPAPPVPATPKLDAPVFTPMTVRPQLVNTDEIQRALVRSYPPALRDAGISGTPTIWFYINEEGAVLRTQLSKSSGHQALDEAALTVARMMRFSPALNRDQRVAVWVEIPIVYRVN
jgi:TonB family protein